MQVFKAFLKILKSRFPSAVIYIVLFFVVGMLMTRSEATESAWEKVQLKMVVEDLDNTAESRALAEILELLLCAPAAREEKEMRLSRRLRARTI